MSRSIRARLERLERQRDAGPDGSPALDLPPPPEIDFDNLSWAARPDEMITSMEAWFAATWPDRGEGVITSEELKARLPDLQAHADRELVALNSRFTTAPPSGFVTVPQFPVPTEGGPTDERHRNE